MLNALYALLFSIASPLAVHVRIEGFIGPDVTPIVTSIDAATGEDLYITFDSPGGMVTEGLKIIDAIERAKLRGQRVHCHAVMAASMAFFAYTHCTYRTAPANGKLLWHRVAFITQLPLHAEDLLDMYKIAKALDTRLLGDTAKSLHKKMPFILEHALKQTMWNADVLNSECPGFLHIQEIQP